MIERARWKRLNGASWLGLPRLPKWTPTAAGISSGWVWFWMKLAEKPKRSDHPRQSGRNLERPWWFEFDDYNRYWRCRFRITQASASYWRRSFRTLLYPPRHPAFEKIIAEFVEERERRVARLRRDKKKLARHKALMRSKNIKAAEPATPIAGRGAFEIPSRFVATVVSFPPWCTRRGCGKRAACSERGGERSMLDIANPRTPSRRVRP